MCLDIYILIQFFQQNTLHDFIKIQLTFWQHIDLLSREVSLIWWKCDMFTYMNLYIYIYIYICVYIFISATMPRAQERVLVLTSASTLLASFGPMIPPRSPMLPPREYKKLRIFPLPQKTSLCAAFLWSAALQIYIFSFCKIEKHKDVFYLWNDFECSPNNLPNSRTADSPNNRSTEPPNPSTTE